MHFQFTRDFVKPAFTSGFFFCTSPLYSTSYFHSLHHIPQNNLVTSSMKLNVDFRPGFTVYSNVIDFCLTLVVSIINMSFKGEVCNFFVNTFLLSHQYVAQSHFVCLDIHWKIQYEQTDRILNININIFTFSPLKKVTYYIIHIFLSPYPDHSSTI